MAKKKRGSTAAGGKNIPLCRFAPDHLQTEALVPVILEFQQPPVAVYRRLNPQANADAYRRALEEHQDRFLQQLSSQCLNVQVGETTAVLSEPSGPQQTTITHRFTEAFNGVSVWMPGRAVPEVAAMAGVRAVTLNQERVYLTLDQSVPFTGAPRIWERKGPDGLPVRGEGMIVAVIDTGVDWTHPALGGFAEVPNEKVVHAVSLTGEHPMDNFGHGTHVAAIIAGDSSYKGTPRGDSLVDGVAPRAKVMGYKVLTAAGSGSASNIVLAIEDAVKRGAHVINLSLGDVQGDPLSPESSAANNAMMAGVVVCAAAGNSGPAPSTIGAPGSAHHVITVGASTDEGVTVLQARLKQEGQDDRLIEMRLMEGSIALPAPAIEKAYVYCGRGAKESDFPAAVKGRIALVERGDATFREKAVGAQAAGAVACLIYNNQPGGFFGTLGDEEAPAVPVVAISQEDGEALRTLIDSSTGYSRGSLQLNPEGIPQPDQIAEFSSRGPNNDGWIKPEITAPGVNIFSATITQAPTPGGGMPDPSGYISASGTSMATPHIAGAVALIRQAHPDWTPLQIKAALVNTARFMPGQGTVMDQGAGALHLEAALDAQAILVTETDPFVPTHAFGRVAHGGKEQRVSQALQLAALPGASGSQEWALAVELALPREGLSAALSAESVVVADAKPARIELTLTADGTKEVDGVCYGWVVARREGAALRLPFFAEITRTLSEKPAPSNQARSRFPGQPIRKRVGELCCC
ncbi:MAG: S8 family serine peptidase [Bacillota bacterium]